jgi:hypothetical protein
VKRTVPHPFESLLVFLLLLPCIWLNHSAPVDWGDDNFQYLAQARNISEGRFTTETGYVYKDYARGMGPPAYPSGFPLLLAAFSVTGLDPYASAMWLTGICLAACGFMVFRWSRRTLPFWASVFLALIFAYSPDMLQLRSEIMSDIPFACFLWTGIATYGIYRDSKNQKWLVASALVAGFAICIRPVGWIWVFAVCGHLVVECFRQRFRNIRALVPDLLYIAAMIAIFIFIQVIWLPADMGESYGSQAFGNDWQTMIRRNFAQYIILWNYYFTQKPVAGTGAVILLCSAAGLFIRRRFIFQPEGIFTVLYFILLVAIWPHTGYRFYLPIVPLLLFFAVYFLHIIFIRRMGNAAFLFWLGMGVWIACLYIPERKQRMQAIRSADGPFCAECKDTWESVGRIVPADEIIAFHRPRALAYLTRRRSFILPEAGSTQSLVDEMRSAGSSFLLIDRVNREYQQTAEQLAADTNSTFLAWSNTRFVLYRLR